MLIATFSIFETVSIPITEERSIQLQMVKRSSAVAAHSLNQLFDSISKEVAGEIMGDLRITESEIRS